MPRRPAAFGKLNPNKYGVLPVLVILENETGKALRLDLTAEFVTADNKHVSALSPDDVQHLGRGDQAAENRRQQSPAYAVSHSCKEGPAECLGDRRPRLRREAFAGGRTRIRLFLFQRGP